MIYPIIRGEKQVGHGFLANDYFITAVHILRENDNAYVIIDGKKVEFDKVVPVYVGRGRDNDPNSADLAFFKFNNIEGGFSILDYTPQKDDVLESYCLHKKEGNNDNEEYEIDFINCVAYKNSAELLDKYCSKGSLIAIEGRIQTRNYDGKDGKKIYVTEVVTSNVQFLDTKKDTAPVEKIEKKEEDPYTDFGNSINADEIELTDDMLPF